MELRAVRNEDFGALYALDQTCFAPGIAWSKAELLYFLKYPGNIAVLAEDGGVLAGFTIAGTQRRKGKVEGRLITIDVDAAQRRRGVGNALLGAAEERLREAGSTTVLLEVAVDNSGAQAFYELHGFVRAGRIPGYYLGRIDAIVMEKQLGTL